MGNLISEEESDKDESDINPYDAYEQEPMHVDAEEIEKDIESVKTKIILNINNKIIKIKNDILALNIKDQIMDDSAKNRWNTVLSTIKQGNMAIIQHKQMYSKCKKLRSKTNKFINKTDDKLRELDDNDKKMIIRMNKGDDALNAATKKVNEAMDKMEQIRMRMEIRME